MVKPSSVELTSAYFKAQSNRVVSTLNRIVSRPQDVGIGYVIPQPDDLAIHDGRRLEATVLFLDICKFPQRACETAEEQAVMLRIVSLFFTEMIRVIEDHGGMVEKNTGDGLMAYFARNDLPNVTIQQRALTCALTMFSAADELINPILVRSSIAPVEFRVCLDHGYITVAKVGAAQRFNGLVAVGTTANIASKMLSIAQANTILIGDAMLKGLPQEWLNEFVQLETLDSGWTYRISAAPYAVWQYRGRWRTPSI